jgi:hypothetical protein
MITLNIEYLVIISLIYFLQLQREEEIEKQFFSTTISIF